MLLKDPVTGKEYPHYTRTDLGWPKTSARYRSFARRHVIVHHGVGRGNGLPVQRRLSIWNAYRRYHLSKSWQDIGYSHGWGDGFTVEGRGWGFDGAHTQQGGNRLGHAFCWIGDGRYTAGTEDGWGALRALVAYGIEQGHVVSDPKWSGHSNWWPKECPGNQLYQAIPDNNSLTPKEAPVIPSDVFKFAQAPGHPVYLLNLLDLTREGIETHEARNGIADLFGVEPDVEQVHEDVLFQFRPKL